MKRMLLQSRTYWYTLLILAISSTASRGKGPVEDSIRCLKTGDFGGFVGAWIAIGILFIVVAMIRWPFNRQVKPPSQQSS